MVPVTQIKEFFLLSARYEIYNDSIRKICYTHSGDREFDWVYY